MALRTQSVVSRFSDTADTISETDFGGGESLISFDRLPAEMNPLPGAKYFVGFFALVALAEFIAPRQWYCCHISRITRTVVRHHRGDMEWHSRRTGWMDQKSSSQHDKRRTHICSSNSTSLQRHSLPIKDQSQVGVARAACRNGCGDRPNLESKGEGVERQSADLSHD